MDQYFNQMEKIVKERKTSSRIRFMLQDVIDLRLVSLLLHVRPSLFLIALSFWSNVFTHRYFLFRVALMLPQLSCRENPDCQPSIATECPKDVCRACILFFLQHNWVSRRADQGPKTIEEIHKEAKIEEQEEQRKVHQQLLSKDSKRRPGQFCSKSSLRLRLPWARLPPAGASCRQTSCPYSMQRRYCT